MIVYENYFTAFSTDSIICGNRDVARKVNRPGTNLTVADTWDGAVGTLGSGSGNEKNHLIHVPLIWNWNSQFLSIDYTVFLDYLGIPSVDIGFSGPYGVYHSVYDSFHWMEKFGDPTFGYHKVRGNNFKDYHKSSREKESNVLLCSGVRSVLGPLDSPLGRRCLSSFQFLRLFNRPGSIHINIGGPHRSIQRQ